MEDLLREAWYSQYMIDYDKKMTEKFNKQIMKGEVTDDLKQSYKELLNSGMFYEFYPELTGNWSKDKDAWNRIQNSNPVKPNETYLDVENHSKSVEEQLRERILQLELNLEDSKEHIQIIHSELSSILSALSNAVENGVQLNIGIVVGQTMSTLSDIVYK